MYLIILIQKSHSVELTLDLIPDCMGSLVGLAAPLEELNLELIPLLVRAVVHGSEKGHAMSFHIGIYFDSGICIAHSIPHWRGRLQS